MGAMSWPTQDELHEIRKIVSEMAGKGTEDVRVVVSPYRICPLGAHVDHQGGIVSAMTINKGILLGFVPSGSTEVQVLKEADFLSCCQVSFSSEGDIDLSGHFMKKN
ncbi:hypothetical protein GOBAR_DD36676 [Gossypium barbadense]|nr:hypothetical protein GOBAR_DD36676 [Gossypium barbadense]